MIVQKVKVQDQSHFSKQIRKYKTQSQFSGVKLYAGYIRKKRNEHSWTSSLTIWLSRTAGIPSSCRSIPGCPGHSTSSWWRLRKDWQTWWPSPRPPLSPRWHWPGKRGFQPSNTISLIIPSANSQRFYIESSHPEAWHGPNIWIPNPI